MIKKGDLVMVVKPTICCGKTGRIGFIFKVDVLQTASGTCHGCKKYFESVDAAQNPATGRYIPIDRLKKIDPPATGDSLPTRADIKEKVKC